MLTIGSGKIFFCVDPVDMRKGFEGLGMIVECLFREEITGNSYFVFINKGRDRMKVPYYDRDGLAIWYKRLEKGRFSKEITRSVLDRREFLMLLEGITPKRLQPRFKIS